MSPSTLNNTDARPVAIILAAGKGTRMPGDLPKVVHRVGGRPMIVPVVETCVSAGCGRLIVVVGYKHERVREAVAGLGAPIEFAEQSPQLGTGHAVLAARGVLGEDASPGRTILVLCGDGPLIRAQTVRQLVDAHRRAGAAATIATAELDDPTGYGRIVRDGAGRFSRIVEHKNATEAERRIREVNPSYYCFESGALFGALDRVGRDSVSGEYYLTDALGVLVSEGRRVEVVRAVPPEDVLSINTPDDLARVDAIYRSRRGEVLTGERA